LHSAVRHKTREENGQAFIAIEFLGGQILKHLIGNHALVLETLLSLAIEIADATGRGTLRKNRPRDI
jgi:hypothetical protein